MKPLLIYTEDKTLIFDTIDDSVGIVPHSDEKPLKFILTPLQMLRVREWINERVRRLIFEGKMNEHLGD